jgi:hypothetical protein
MSVAMHAPASRRDPAHRPDAERSAASHGARARTSSRSRPPRRRSPRAAPAIHSTATPGGDPRRDPHGGHRRPRRRAFPTHAKLRIPGGRTQVDVLADQRRRVRALPDDRPPRDARARGRRHDRHPLPAEGDRRRPRAIIGDRGQQARRGRGDARGCGDPERLRARASVLAVKYPQGAEKMLIRTLLGRVRCRPAACRSTSVAWSCHRTSPRCRRDRAPAAPRPGHPGARDSPSPARPSSKKRQLPRADRHARCASSLEQAGRRGRHHPGVPRRPDDGHRRCRASTSRSPRARPASWRSPNARPAGLRRAARVRRASAAAPASTPVRIFLNPGAASASSPATAAYQEMADDSYRLADCFECGSCTWVCPSHHARWSRASASPRRRSCKASPRPVSVFAARRSTIGSLAARRRAVHSVEIIMFSVVLRAAPGDCLFAIYASTA